MIPPPASGNSTTTGGPSSLQDELDLILTSPNFSVAMYLNKAIATTTSNNDKEQQQKMAELALQLQFQTQACHDEIGKISAEVQAILPRCAADIGRVQMGLQGLNMDAEQLLTESTGKKIVASPAAVKPSKTLSSSSSSPQKRTSSIGSEEKEDTNTATNTTTSLPKDAAAAAVSSSLETLSTLHALQANLSRTKEILTAAATWDTTLQSITQLLAATTTTTTTTTNHPSNQQLPQAVQLLAQLENGERALRGMPFPEERQSAIVKLRSQVSSLLQPQLKHALATANNTSDTSSSSTAATGPTKGATTAASTTTAGSGTSSSTNLAPLQQCVSLYTKLNQMDVLKSEYIKHRPNAIHRLWFEYNPAIMGGMDTTTDDPQPNYFATTWLPNWLDAVLTMVTEERRQASLIFAKPEIVPEIVIKVLAECFRPILPSFKTRLEQIYSSNAGGINSSGNKGTLSDISTIYESMLQFMALTYESIAACWIDLMESSSSNVTTSHTNIHAAAASSGGTANTAITKITNAPTFFKELTNVFVQIAAPFTAYQKNLPQLESKYLSTQTRKLAQQLQQQQKEVVAASSNLEDYLQTSFMDQLLDLSSTKIVPIAEGAIARLELLNGGYSAVTALQTIDRILAGHASDVALAIHKLSSSSNDQQFDESHVLNALQVLKVAGSHKRTMQSLQNKTRERLQLLCERMTSHQAREKQLEEAFRKLSVGGKVNFHVPDSMSVVEIDSLLTKAVLYNTADSPEDVTNTNTPLAVLERLASTQDTLTSLYPEAEESSKRLANSCHTFVFDVCFSVPRLHLSNMSSMAAWKEQELSSTQSELSYGTLPQQYITQVGEHMLALVQALEPFAVDRDALELANEVMDDVRSVAQQPWLDFISAASASAGSENLARVLMEGHDLIDYVIGAIPLEDEEEDEEEEQDEHSKASTAFCNKWLDVVGLAVTGRLLERIMRIPTLTTKGCEHLNADLGYLVNVFSALGISGHPHPLVGHLAEISILDKDIVSERINSTLDRSNPTSDFLRAVEERLSAMRGLNNRY